MTIGEGVSVKTSQGRVGVLGFKIYYRSFGMPDKGTILALAGGPFGTHGMILPMADLVQFGYRVVMYDYLGCGKSDRPKEAQHYTQSHAVEEVEGIRKALGLGRIHLFGISYGGALALDVALKYPKNLRSLLISSGFASQAFDDSEWNPHLPKRIREALTKYGDKGDLKNSKFLAAKDFLNRTEVCRLRVWPYDAWHSLEQFANDNIGDNLPRRLEGWDITDRLAEIKIPCLVAAGEYDLRSPKCAQVIHRGIKGSKLVVFENCSHTAIWEDRVRFIEVVRDFLDGIPTRPRKRP